MAPKTKPSTLRYSHTFANAKLKAAMIRVAREHGRTLVAEINTALKAWVKDTEKRP